MCLQSTKLFCCRETVVEVWCFLVLVLKLKLWVLTFQVTWQCLSLLPCPTLMSWPFPLFKCSRLPLGKTLFKFFEVASKMFPHSSCQLIGECDHGRCHHVLEIPALSQLERIAQPIGALPPKLGLKTPQKKELIVTPSICCRNMMTKQTHDWSRIFNTSGSSRTKHAHSWSRRINTKRRIVSHCIRCRTPKWWNNWWFKSSWFWNRSKAVPVEDLKDLAPE